MKHIGLLSDTHGFIDDRLLTFFDKCDEIWHAGDIGNLVVAEKLAQFKPFKAVYGNIDDYKMRLIYPEILHFQCEGMNTMITHIGGYPGHYSPGIPALIKHHHPGLFIAGHSHILKVIYDKKNDLLHINPGASGNSGFHLVKTAIRFTIDDAKVTALEIWESPRG